MYSTKYATAATERATCTSSDSDHAHAATNPAGSTDAVWTTPTDDGSEHLGCSKQR